jgi:hypothetical protein
MYVTLKRLTPVVVLFFSFLRGKGRPSLQVSHRNTRSSIWRQTCPRLDQRHQRLLLLCL